LYPVSRRVEFDAASHPQNSNFINIVRHRFERIIAGQYYLIEATWVAEKRWRAAIVRIPGVPTAMMPFYGETPDQAAANLTNWLDRAHQNQASNV
jgi:hypothetical protein